MAKSSIRIRAKLKNEITEVKCIIRHPMETCSYSIEDSTTLPDMHFIQEITCQHNGRIIMNALCGPTIAKDPYLAFKFIGGKIGDIVKINWVDNKGSSESQTATID